MRARIIGFHNVELGLSSIQGTALFHQSYHVAVSWTGAKDAGRKF